MIRTWAKILPYWIIERFILRFGGNLHLVKFGGLKPRMCYTFAMSEGMILVRDVDDVKRSKLLKLKREVEKIEQELEVSS